MFQSKEIKQDSINFKIFYSLNDQHNIDSLRKYDN